MMQITNIPRKMPCASKSRRFWSIMIDFLAIFVLFFIARLIILNDEVVHIVKNFGLSLDRNHSITVTRLESIIFMLIDLTIPLLIFYIVPTLTKGKTLGMMVMRIRVFKMSAQLPGFKTYFIRFSPYIVGFGLIAISQTIIDGERVKMWPSWLINDIDYILSSHVLDNKDNIETIISAVLSTIPYLSGVGIMFNDDARMFAEKLTDTAIIYDGGKIYQTDRNIKLISLMESKDDEHIDIKM